MSQFKPFLFFVKMSTIVTLNIDIYFQLCDKLNQTVVIVDVSSDIRNIAKQRGSNSYTPEQILVDCYVSKYNCSTMLIRRN